MAKKHHLYSAENLFHQEGEVNYRSKLTTATAEPCPIMLITVSQGFKLVQVHKIVKYPHTAM